MKKPNLASEVIRRALGVLWFFVLPALLAGLTLRYLVPNEPASESSGPGEFLSWAFGENPLAAGALLFLVFSALGRYWAGQLVPDFGLGFGRAGAPPGGKPQRARGALAFAALLGLAVVAAVALRSTVFQSYRVLGSSMLPTLELGDHVLANRLAYSGSKLPQRGDVVAFRAVVNGVGEEVLKRVIGLPGDRIEMHGGFPIINGFELPSCDVGRYVHVSPSGVVNGRVQLEFLEDRHYLTAHVPGARPFEGYRVKPGEVFVLGDNRNQSHDSRNWKDGHPAGLELTTIAGRVTRILRSTLRNGATDFTSILRSPGVDLNLDGLDIKNLEAGIERCLKNPPKNTYPPKPDGSTANAALSLRATQ